MKSAMLKPGHKKYITDVNGEVEFVVIPVQEYNKIIELLEDYGLGLAIKEAEGEKSYSKEEALRYLGDA